MSNDALSKKELNQLKELLVRAMNNDQLLVTFPFPTAKGQKANPMQDRAQAVQFNGPSIEILTDTLNHPELYEHLLK